MHSRFLQFVLCSTALASWLVVGCGTGGSTPGSGSGGSSGTPTGGSASGGAVGTGGNASTGGNANTGGSSASGGSTRTGGTTGSGGSASTGGSTATGGTSGTGGRSATGGAGTGGGNAGGSSGGAKFSFFMASQAGLARLANNANGFGGDLRFGQADGLAGADEICKRLAEASMPNNGKTWRAFLSVTKGPGGTAVNAIDRVGEGPWYDRLGRLVSMNKAGLLNERPQGADAAIINDLPNEDGIPNHNPGTGVIDNHNVLTGSTVTGTLDSQGLTATCQDWTSAVSSGGRPRCGVSWPRSSIVHWISELNEGGCAPGSTPAGGAQSGPQGTVGALGGYGGIYCMATTP